MVYKNELNSNQKNIIFLHRHYYWLCNFESNEQRVWFTHKKIVLLEYGLKNSSNVTLNILLLFFLIYKINANSGSSLNLILLLINILDFYSNQLLDIGSNISLLYISVNVDLDIYKDSVLNWTLHNILAEQLLGVFLPFFLLHSHSSLNLLISSLLTSFITSVLCSRSQVHQSSKHFKLF